MYLYIMIKLSNTENLVFKMIILLIDGFIYKRKLFNLFLII